MYRPPPPPPPILVGGRHHCHLSSAVAAPLVAGAGAIARQLQSLVSATVTSGRNDDLLGRIYLRRWPLSCFLHYLSPTAGTPTAAVTTALSSPRCCQPTSTLTSSAIGQQRMGGGMR
jgi:hypothetical protein